MMHEAYIVMSAIYDIVVVVAILHVLMDNRQPVKTMAWALVIFFVPVVGLLFYFFFGINTRRERIISERSLNQLTKRSMLEFVEQENLTLPEANRLTIDIFINQNLALPFKSNEVEIFTTGEDFFADLISAIGKARRHIHMALYIFEDDPLGRLLCDVLIDKAREGVEVRVIYDDVGCWNVPSDFYEQMRKAGIDVNAFLPVRFPQFTRRVNYRNHRKMIVVDGETGYIGGMNIALRYVRGTTQPWRDTMTRVKGGAVYGLQRAFLVDWYFVDRSLISGRQYYPPIAIAPNACLAQVVTSAPTSPYSEIMHGYTQIIHAARSYVYIETPYFMPSEPVLFALKTAALSGVDVRIIVPRKCESRFVHWASQTFLHEVMRAGVKVYQYEAGFLHSKILVSDDSLSTCGSTNMDFRSFENNFESNIFFYDTPTAEHFKSIFADDQRQSSLLNDSFDASNNRFITRLVESLTRLISPLM